MQKSSKVAKGHQKYFKLGLSFILRILNLIWLLSYCSFRIAVQERLHHSSQLLFGKD